ncbi:MAG TPA: DUF5615 family PIN-like protein [Candidatus Udaeobacter sp.]|nr:DUF5615 family PIN-like protein [Candidatus Udaeobacter sp.]
MRFLADMGVAMRIVEWLRAQGHDVKHLREEGLQRMPDGDIFFKAATESRILLTFDLDFGEILALSRERNVSVVLFRLHNTRKSHVQSPMPHSLAWHLNARAPQITAGDTPASTRLRPARAGLRRVRSAYDG